MSTTQLKHELNVAANQLVDGIGDVREFGMTTRSQLDTLRSFRKSRLDMDCVHQQIIDAQQQQEHAHNYHQSISPALLHPRRFLNLHPLNKECFTDMHETENAGAVAAQMPELISTISPTSPLEPNYAQNEGTMSATHTSPNVNEDLSRTPASSSQPEDTCSLLNELQQITSIKPEQIIDAVESNKSEKNGKKRKRKRSKSSSSRHDDEEEDETGSELSDDSGESRCRKKKRKINRDAKHKRKDKDKARDRDRTRERNRSHTPRKRSPRPSSSDRDSRNDRYSSQKRYRNQSQSYAHTPKVKQRTRGHVAQMRRRHSHSSHAHVRKSLDHHQRDVGTHLLHTYANSHHEQQQQQQQQSDIMEIEYGLSDCNNATEAPPPKIKTDENEHKTELLYSNMWIPTRSDT